MESSKGGNFRGSIYGGKKISNVNFVEPFFSGGGVGGGLLPEFYGIYIHHCDLYTNREEKRLADHCQSPHR